MSRTRKHTEARAVCKAYKEPLPHPSTKEWWTWDFAFQMIGRRYGNKRKHVAKVKLMGRRSERRKQKMEIGKEA